jgi:Protein of unknown function (DUF3099)
VSRSPQQPVYSVTGARRGASDDLAQRQRRYLISMSIRTACFVLAVVTHGPIRWVLVAAALVLPYIAVVMANAVGSGTGEAPTAYVPTQVALDSSHHEALGESVRLGPDTAPPPPSAAAPPAAAPQAGRPAADGEPVARA